MPSNDERRRRDLLTARARQMRSAPTDAEKRLWTMLRDRRLPGKFRRQHVVGAYIVDFVDLTHGLIVEADGGQHAESRSDDRRNAFLRSAGFRVLRFWNNDILTNSQGVYEAITAALHTPHPPKPAAWAPPSPLPGEGSPSTVPLPAREREGAAQRRKGEGCAQQE